MSMKRLRFFLPLVLGSLPQSKNFKYLLATLNLQFLILVEQEDKVTGSNSDAVFHQVPNDWSPKKAYAQSLRIALCLCHAYR